MNKDSLASEPDEEAEMPVGVIATNNINESINNSNKVDDGNNDNIITADRCDDALNQTNTKGGATVNGNPIKRLLVCTCLNPKRSLRYQLIASFGCIAVFTILCSVLLAAISASRGGQVIKDNARELLYNQVTDSTKISSKYQADLITQRIGKLRTGVALIVEIARDAIVRYPDVILDDTTPNKDEYVPFKNIIIDDDGNDSGSGASASYPFRVKENLLRPDWQTEPNINQENILQHVHAEREAFYSAFTEFVSTSHGTLTMAGNCHPGVTDPNNGLYFPNCTEANNDFNNGGAIFNSEPDVVKSTRYLAQKANDIALFIKPLWEAEADAWITTIGFKNLGAGLWMSFPATFSDGTSSYTSIGCDWMRTINPYTNKPLGTEKEISRCHPNGSVVPGRLYNPMERAWCREQALNPGKTTIFGPYADASAVLYWLTIGQAIFDRSTGEFIGCATIDLPTNVIENFLASSIVGNFTSAILMNRDGIVVSGEQQGKEIWKTDQMDKVSYDKLTDVSNYWESNEFSRTVTYNNNVLSAYPIPTPPTEFDPGYRAEFYVVIITDGDIFDVAEKIDNDIDNDVSHLIVKAILVGGIGLVLVLLIIWSVSRTLTLPLQWMENISTRIVNHSAKDAAAELRAIQELDMGDDDSSNGSNSANTNITNSNGSKQRSITTHPSSTSFASRETGTSRSFRSSLRSFAIRSTAPEANEIGQSWPKTEITALVTEFKEMIRGFSGAGPSTVARTTSIQEIPNVVSWQAEFQDLYKEQPEMERGVYAPVDFHVPESKLETITEPETEQEHLSEVPAPDSEGAAVGTNGRGNGGNPNEPVDMNSDDNSVTDPPVDRNPFSGSAELISSPKQKAASRYLPISEESSVTVPAKINCGQNLEDTVNEIGHCSDHQSTILEDKRPASSSLFWWVVGLIMIPLLVSNIVICVLVSVDLLKTFPAWVESAESLSLQIELDSLVTGASLRASFAERYLEELLRDVYLFTRMSQYVLLDVVDRRDTIPFMDLAATEECKEYSEDLESCPIFDDEDRALCDCEWDDLFGAATCKDYTYDTRFFQHTWFAGQATDADPVTGDRINGTSYPKHSTSSDTTKWFDDISVLPGIENGSFSSGYTTVYDRFRATGALSAVVLPLFNYVKTASNLLERTRLGIYFAFESDGSIWGYTGCSINHAEFSTFESNDKNQAHMIKPEFCPKGKFGYDARCRAWYDDAKKLLVEKQDPVHLTLPYAFALTKQTGMSAVSSVTNPQTGELIGQTLIDFTPERILTALLDDTNAFFSFLVSPVDEAGGDTVVGPGQKPGDTPKPIPDVILPFDRDASKNRGAFRDIVAKMKLGESGSDRFKRRKADGSEEEEDIRISYAPVYARVLSPIQPDSYASGSAVTRKLVYSVGVAEKLNTLQNPFLEIEQDIDDSLRRFTAVYVSLVVIIVILCIIFTSQVSIVVTIPMIVLLRVVQNVNDGKIDEELPDFHGGSIEANQVYNSFAKLYKIVRVANMAFFSGNLKWAYDVIYDAMQLFRKVNDHKAIGIACNNLGCTLFAMSRTDIHDDDSNNNNKNNNDTTAFEDLNRDCHLVNGVCSVKSAVKYMNEAVAIGKRMFEDCDNEETKAKYAYQLADRYFNRAMCILNSLNDRCCPSRAMKTGYADLQKAKSLDQSAKETLVRINMLMRYSDIYFERLLRRMHGLASIIRVQPNVGSIWNPKELVDEANQFLQEKWDRTTLPVFDDMNRIGRLQQLEGAVMNLQISSGHNAEASSVGLRMFAEDEYLIDSSYAAASEALLRFAGSQDCNWSQEAAFNLRCDLLNGLKSCKGGIKDKGKSLIFAIEVSDKLRDHFFLTSLNKGCLALFDDGCQDADYVGVIAFGDNLSSGKIEEYGSIRTKGPKLRRRVDSATRKTSGRSSFPTLPLAAQMVVDAPSMSSKASRDTYLVFITDGTLWDSQSMGLMFSEIEQLYNVSSAVHLIIIGLEVRDEAVVSVLRNLCQLSSHSVYVDATRHSIHGVLARVASLISAKSFFMKTSIRHALTMEKF